MIRRTFCLLLLGMPVAAQQPSVSRCSYEQCSLAIAPAWDGLDVAQGIGGARVARLGFFWTGSVASAFSSDALAVTYADRAVTVRRSAAILTDAGAMLLGYAAVRHQQGNALQGRDRVILVTGVSAITVSVPLQFMADGLLSRAVWLYNRRFAP